MERFNKRGMLIIPNPIMAKDAVHEKSLVVGQLYCPEGHDLINRRVVFNGYPGILIKVQRGSVTGMVGMSPICGDHARISIDIDLSSGEIMEFICPVCGTSLLRHSQCSCGADLIAFFTEPMVDFTNCIGICSRVDCKNSQILINDELVSLSMIDTF